MAFASAGWFGMTGVGPAPVVAWVVAALWGVRALGAWRGVPRVANLLRPAFDREPEGRPRLRVVVPARNEAGAILACLRSLLGQDYARLEIVAVDDRSDDATGALMDRAALEGAGRLTVLHLTELPAGWLGKTHAMACGAGVGEGEPEWLLFTDGDVLFRPDALRRALAYAVACGADHLVLAPTTMIERWDEAALLSFFQIFGIWAARPWRVADPRARDAIGVGAFNLIRRQAYERVGGFAALKMAVVEDLGLARRVKQAGLRQQMAFGRDMVRVHWAAGVDGLIRTMTKNIFAAFGYRPERLLGGCVWLVVFCVLPYGMVWVPGFRTVSAVVVGAMVVSYAVMARHSGLSAWNVVYAPFAAVVFMYALVRSMVVTLRQGGIIWRGTFYSLEELRRNSSAI